MRVSELQIGDYVNWRGLVLKVTLLSDKGGWNEVGFNEEEWMSLNADYVEPIPLTAEILEKNGWTRDRGSGIFYPKQLKGELSWIRYAKDGDNWKFRIRDFCEIKYVHELQHTLRLCEIDKEIEL